MMNLIDLMTRSDNRLLVGGGGRQIKFRLGQDIWRGVEFSQNAAQHLKITGLDKIRRLQTLPEHLGWFARVRKVKSEVAEELQATGTTTLRKGGGDLGSTTFSFGNSMTPVPMPWAGSQNSLSAGSELVVSFDIPAGCVVELIVHKALNRVNLLALATGNGVEVGPGPKPQVLESNSTSVRYVEEMPIEKWKELYDTTGKYGTGAADFSKYIIGTADKIPAEKNSLDFIFSSHVFEHLANPLGHLIRWQHILTSGGVVLAVIPEMHSTKDLIATPSTIEEMEAERGADIWSPTLFHYERWLGFRGMSYSAEEMMARKSSIHVHFYDKVNVTALLDKAVRDYGFSSYKIVHEDNHKDFHFCLWK